MPPKSTDCPTNPPCTLAANNTTTKSEALKAIVSVDASQVVILDEKKNLLVTYERQEYTVNESESKQSGGQSASHTIHYFTPTPQSVNALKEYTGRTIYMQLTSEVNYNEHESKEEVLSLKLELLG